MKHHITFVRSVATPSALLGCYVGLRDEPPDDEAKAYFREAWRDIPKADRIYSGCYRRCRETAELIASGGEIKLLEDLIPCDYGDFTGLTYNQIRQTPEFLGWASTRLPGESLPGAEFFRKTSIPLWEKNKQIFERIIEEAADRENANIIIVAHGSFIRHVIHAFGSPRDHYFCIDIPSGGGVRIVYDGNEEIAYFKKY